MQLIKAIFDIRYSASPEGLDIVERLYANITGENPGNNAPSFLSNFNIQNKKTTVSVTARQTNIAIESLDLDDALDVIITLYEKISEAVKYGKADRIALRCIFFHKQQLEFDALVSRYKTEYFSDNKLISEASDIAVVVTSKADGYDINYVAGPMKAGDIVERYLAFPYERKLPPVYSCVDLDFSQTDFKLSVNAVAKFLKQTAAAQIEFVDDNTEEVSL